MALTIKTKRSLLRLTTLGLFVPAVWLACRAYQVRPTDSLKIELTKSQADRDEHSSSLRRPLDSAAPLWRKPLRRPLYDPPPPPPKKVVKKKLPPLRAKLMGTIIEPGASKAMISVPGGSVEFRSEGDPLSPQDAGAVITRIGPDSIEVARGEVKTELKIERPF